MELTGNNNAIERTASQAHQTVDDLARRATDKAGPAIDRVARAAHQTVDKVAQAAHPRRNGSAIAPSGSCRRRTRW
jgi:hypothetical protein